MNLRAYLARRLAIGLVQVLGVATLVFVLTEALPGDAAVTIAGDVPDPERIAHLRTVLGLDRPAPARFLEWLGGIARGDLGVSLSSGRPVLDTLLTGMASTGALAALTIALLAPIGIGLGTLAGMRVGGVLDRVISSVVLGAYSVPEFASAIALVAVFALWLGVLPANALGMSGPLLAHPEMLVLPVLVLLVRPVCSIARLTRVGVADGLTSDYAAHARRLGLPGRSVLCRHVLPSTASPVIQQLAHTTDWLLGGVIVVEAIFVIPGLGTTLVDAVHRRDIPLVQGLALLFGAVTICVNTVADVATYRLTGRAAAR